ncbi:MAG TPA: hypothetical protein VJU16_07515 [Planctomycetota bacterium]|nr:hypothetical protein [Planctomycetota bacterium]
MSWRRLRRRLPLRLRMGLGVRARGRDPRLPRTIRRVPRRDRAGLLRHLHRRRPGRRAPLRRASSLRRILRLKSRRQAHLPLLRRNRRRAGEEMGRPEILRTRNLR